MARDASSVTGFYNLATPIIRYAIGDYAETAAAPCPCGCTLPALTRVLGRQRNMFVFGDDTRIWPRSDTVTGLGDLLPMRQFQAVQTAHDHIELRYVPADPLHRPDTQAILGYFRQTLHPSVAVSLAPMADIPRSAGGKVRGFRVACRARGAPCALTAVPPLIRSADSTAASAPMWTASNS